MLPSPAFISPACYACIGGGSAPLLASRPQPVQWFQSILLPQSGGILGILWLRTILAICYFHSRLKSTNVRFNRAIQIEWCSRVCSTICSRTWLDAEKMVGLAFRSELGCSVLTKGNKKKDLNWPGGKIKSMCKVGVFAWVNGIKYKFQRTVYVLGL